MKRLLICLLSMILLLSLAPDARADVLWEPDNNFYKTHAEECTYIGRTYYANGPEGYVTLWNAPNGSIVAAQYENCFRLHVYWQYQDWGCVTVWDDGKSVSGWVSMPDLYLVYDHISFEEEYGNTFQEYEEQFADYTGSGEGLQAWEYPYAGAPKYVWTDENREIVSALTGTADTGSSISQVYKDPSSGDTWGYVGYLFGHRNFWINLDHPTGEGMMSSCIPKEDELFSSGELIPPQTPVMPVVFYIPYLLVGGTVLVTLGLLAWFYRRKRKPE